MVVSWTELDPGVAWVYAKGGTLADRYLAEQIMVSKLAAHGIERAQFTFDREHRTADWDEIMEKARRLINSGNVQMLRNSYNVLAAHVVGDHGEYDTEIGRDDPDSRAITTWKCTCPWDQFAWGRTRKWKKYEGRPCAHVLATQWVGQSMPLDEELEPDQTLPPGQRGFQPQTPADIPQGDQMQLPFQEQGPVVPPQQAPPAQPSVPSILPEFPAEQMQLVPPGTLQPGQPGITVSMPGARQPSPFNPMQNPSTYSKVNDWVFEGAFENSDMVRLEEDEPNGVMVGKSPAHGAGQKKLIPKGSIGEVMGEDGPLVQVNFDGPQSKAGPMEPYHVTAWLWPSQLTPMPNISKPGPVIRRRV